MMLLKRSMEDQLIGIDVEWAADKSEAHNNRIALVQLTTSSCAALIRTCKLKYQLPEDVLDFLLYEPG